MFVIISEIAICLIIVFVFGLIIGWKLAKNSKLEEYKILSNKFLKAEKELKELKKRTCKI